MVFQLNRRHAVDNFLIRKEINFITITINLVFIAAFIPYVLFNVSLIQMWIIGYSIAFCCTIISVAFIIKVLKLKRDANKKKMSSKRLVYIFIYSISNTSTWLGCTCKLQQRFLVCNFLCFLYI